MADAVIQLRENCGADLAATALESGYPIGMDVEVVSAEALREAAASAADRYEREHVTAFVWRRPERFRAVYVDRRPDLRSLRLAVDTPEDFELVSDIYAALHQPGRCFGLREIEALLADRPDLRHLNASVEQNPYEWGN